MILELLTILEFEEWIEILSLILRALSSIAIPFVIFIVGNKISNTQEIKKELRDDRIEIYNKILEPFFILFATGAVLRNSINIEEILSTEEIDNITRENKEKAITELAKQKLYREKLHNLEYQEYVFKLSLIGSDAVVQAYNNLMQAYYHSSQLQNNGQDLIFYMAVLLFEIRKSLGNKATKLHILEMLEWKINDLRRFKRQGKYPNMKKYYSKTEYIENPNTTTESNKST
jgi:SpoVK/Ycf46/Vps4 family AAA+-type ATPase